MIQSHEFTATVHDDLGRDPAVGKVGVEELCAPLEVPLGQECPDLGLQLVVHDHVGGGVLLPLSKLIQPGFRVVVELVGLVNVLCPWKGRIATKEPEIAGSSASAVAQSSSPTDLTCRSSLPCRWLLHGMGWQGMRAITEEFSGAVRASQSRPETLPVWCTRDR